MKVRFIRIHHSVASSVRAQKYKRYLFTQHTSNGHFQNDLRLYFGLTQGLRRAISVRMSFDSSSTFNLREVSVSLAVNLTSGGKI